LEFIERIGVDIPRKYDIMTLLRAILISGIGYFCIVHRKRTAEFIDDCLGMSIAYVAKIWPDLSEKVLASSSKVVKDLYERAKKKRGDVA